MAGVLMSTGGKGRRGDAFVLRLIFIQNERTSYWVARPERARWFWGRSSQNAAWECCIIGFTQVDGGVTSHRVAWPGHYLVTGGGGDRTIDAGSPRGGSPAAPAGAVTTEGMETGATATTTRVWSLTQIFAFSLLLHN